MCSDAAERNAREKGPLGPFSLKPGSGALPTPLAAEPSAGGILPAQPGLRVGAESLSPMLLRVALQLKCVASPWAADPACFIHELCVLPARAHSCQPPPKHTQGASAEREGVGLACGLLGRAHG